MTFMILNGQLAILMTLLREIAGMESMDNRFITSIFYAGVRTPIKSALPEKHILHGSV